MRLKLFSISYFRYFDSGWNIFDLVIVVASLVDIFAENLNGISVLRGMRLVSTKTQKISAGSSPLVISLRVDPPRT